MVCYNKFELEEKMKDIFICLAIIIGTIIGAGFASGREILNFFNSYETKGLFGILISSILFGIITSVILLVVKKKNIKEYSELVSNQKFIEVALKIFSVVCFCIMISGVGTFADEQLNINFWYGSALAASFSYIMFLKKFKGIEVFNCLLVPFIILGILIIGFSNYDGMTVFLQNKVENENSYYRKFYFVCYFVYKL